MHLFQLVCFQLIYSHQFLINMKKIKKLISIGLSMYIISEKDKHRDAQQTKGYKANQYCT